MLPQTFLVLASALDRLRLSAVPISLVFFLLAGCSPAEGKGNSHPQVRFSRHPNLPANTLLLPSTQEVDLGTLRPGGRTQQTISLSNQQTQPVDLARIETSCDCLRLRLPSRVLRPSETVDVEVIADFSTDPDFKGSLGIEVNGRTQSGQLAFALIVYVNVFRNSS